MEVVVLCGGEGTRLREETEFRPKPMVLIGGKPILWHIMKSYSRYGFHDFVLCLGYRGDVIKKYFVDYEPMSNDFTISLGAKPEIQYHGVHDEQGYRVTLVDTGLRTMTGARLKRAAQHITGDTFMLTYGDGLSDINIESLLAFHKQHGKLATVTAVNPPSRFGTVDIEPKTHLASFREKVPTGAWVSAGFFVFERKVIDYIDDSPDNILEGKPLQKLAEDNELVAYEHDGFFYAMDTYREYLMLNRLWDAGSVPWLSEPTR